MAAAVFATATASLSVEKSKFVRPSVRPSVQSDKEEKRMMKNDANQRDAEECRACKIRLCCRRRSVVRWVGRILLLPPRREKLRGAKMEEGARAAAAKK